MATTGQIEEYFAELARAVGDIHEAVVGGVGTEAEPGTALFEIEQLRSLAATKLPKFGILQTTTPGFDVTPSEADSLFVTVGSGEVAYNGSRLTFQQQDVPITRAFAPALYTATYDTYQYGLVLGIPLSEVKKSTRTYATITTATATGSSTSLEVADLSIADTLGFPLSAYVGTQFCIFSGFNDAHTALVVHSSINGGIVPGAPVAGTRVHFIYDPRVLALYGMPVHASFGSGAGDPEDFYYYPSMPSTWLPVAKVLVENVRAPAIMDSGNAILRTVVEWPLPEATTPVWDSRDAALIASAAEGALASLRQVRDAASVAEVLGAMEEYTAAVAATPQTSFSEHWASASFRPNSYFGAGVCFDGLERFDFPKSFKKAYYDITKDDLQHTFAIFRGDKYHETNPPVGDQLSISTAEAVLARSAPSSLSRGTYVYGVSAVIPSGGGYVETSPAYASILADANEATYFLNHLEYTAVVGAEFYHVYRRSSLAGDQIEYRLTAEDELQGSGSFNMTPATITAHESLAQGSTRYHGIKLVTSGSTQFGGIEIDLQLTSGTITNTSDVIAVTFHEDNAGEPNTLIATGTSIPYGDVTSTATKFISVFSGVDAITLGGTYWAVLHLATPPSGGVIGLGRAATGTATYATSDDGSTWATLNNKTPYYKLYGFLDTGLITSKSVSSRGVRLTGDQALKPRRLSVYVPPVEAEVVRGDVPLTAEDGDPILTGDETDETKNELRLTVVARNGASGTPTTMYATVPQGTPRGTRILLGQENQLFDRVDDVQVRPGSALRLGDDSQVEWSVYDLVTVETTP